MADHSLRGQSPPAPLALRSQRLNPSLESEPRRGVEHRGHRSPYSKVAADNLLSVCDFGYCNCLLRPLVSLRSRLELRSPAPCRSELRRCEKSAGRAWRILLLLVRVFLLRLFYLRLAQRLRRSRVYWLVLFVG